MDAISITGIRCYGYTGFFKEEKFLGQWFEVDLKLWLDLTAPSQNDSLENTLDYSKVVAVVKELVKTSKFDLIEKLAGEVARAILEFELVEKVDVKLTKVSAPIPDFDGTIAIELSRSKGESF
ncbi:MAG: dihydroneopterin aldolase [Okeania sp. SIO2H7]|nr:dihydroneopterin aldolase [Okeania sp. SIO2H7]